MSFDIFKIFEVDVICSVDRHILDKNIYYKSFISNKMVRKNDKLIIEFKTTNLENIEMFNGEIPFQFSRMSKYFGPSCGSKLKRNNISSRELYWKAVMRKIWRLSVIIGSWTPSPSVRRWN